MIFSNYTLYTIVASHAYICIYNISLISLFIVFTQHILTKFKTIYAFNDYYFNTFFLNIITITLLSLAGVPPFIGFFSKLLILITLINSVFFIFYIFFFALLLLALYFYLQNIRFLFSSQSSVLSYSYLNFKRINSLATYVLIIIVSVLINGVFIFDDILLFFY